MYKAGDWTEQLHKIVDRPTKRPVWVAGPFASPYSTAVDFDNLVLVASGIGITPALSILACTLAPPAARLRSPSSCVRAPRTLPALCCPPSLSSAHARARARAHRLLPPRSTTTDGPCLPRRLVVCAPRLQRTSTLAAST
jgi:hypothetical protein